VWALPSQARLDGAKGTFIVANVHLIAKPTKTCTEKHWIPGANKYVKNRFKTTAMMRVLEQVVAKGGLPAVAPPGESVAGSPPPGKFVPWFVAGDFNTLERQVAKLCAEASAAMNVNVEALCHRRADEQERRDWVISGSALQLDSAPCVSAEQAHFAVVVSLRAGDTGEGVQGVAVSSQTFSAAAKKMLKQNRAQKAEYESLAQSAARAWESLKGAVPSKPLITLREGGDAMWLDYEDGHPMGLYRMAVGYG